MSEEATLDEFAGVESDESNKTKKPELIQGVAWSTIDSVPEEWTVNNVESDIDILSGNNFSSDYFIEDGGIPLIRIRDLAENETTVNFDGEYESRYLIKQRDLLVGMDGEFEPHLWSGPQALLNQRVCKIEPKNKYNKIFFRYAIEKPLFYIQKSIAGTTVKHLSQSNINDINLPTPPLSEQRKIATVLYTVDQAIEKTETIVSRLERVYSGLFQKLIPGGIGHEQYNDIRILGRTVQTPTSWDITTVSDACSEIIDYRGKNPKFSEEGIPHFRNINIERGKILLDDLKYVSEETYNEWMTRGIPQEGDTLLSTEAPMGKTAVLPEMKFSLSQRLIVLRPGERFDNQFFAHLMGSPFVQKEYEARATGSTVKGISNYNLQEVTIPVPPRKEQEEIAQQIDEILDVIQINEQKVDRLKHLKQGLMQDLLSGKVKTTDTTIQVPDEVAQHG